MTPSYAIRILALDAGPFRARRTRPPRHRRDRRAELDAERVRLRFWRWDLAKSAELMRIVREIERERLEASSTGARLTVCVSGTATASNLIYGWSS